MQMYEVSSCVLGNRRVRDAYGSMRHKFIGSINP